MYDTVLFDFDHTLFDTTRAERAAYDHAMAAAGVSAPDQYFDDYLSINRAMWRRVEQGEMRPTDVRNARFVELLPRLTDDGYVVDPHAMADRFAWGMANFGDLYPLAREVLEQVRAGRRLALITNGLSEVQRRRLELTGLADVFDAVVISSEVGANKPDRAIFDATFAALGHPTPTTAIIVGDSLSSDIRGGADYGIATCWFNPRHHVASAEQLALVTHEIHHLDELGAVLDGAEPRSAVSRRPMAQVPGLDQPE